MYKARNDFLHGGPFTKTHLEPWPQRQTNLVSLAAIVYRQALLLRLEQLFPSKPVTSLADITAETISGLFSDDLFEKAMLVSVGEEPEA